VLTHRTNRITHPVRQHSKGETVMTTSNPQTKPHIGFIGLGHMGELMALRLLQAGYPMSIYDRTKEKTQELAGQGATVATTPQALAQQSDIIISRVTDTHALNSVMHGPDGAIAGAHQGSIFIDMSTVSPQESRHIAEQVKEKGASMLDAAVSGSTPQVKEGTLVIFVGGEQEIYQRCKPTTCEMARGTSEPLQAASLSGLFLNWNVISCFNNQCDCSSFR
jgi:3-hydroxyisobutyrate dehydrogenase-like beta-hydroxyacid dehydrogenase